MPVKAKILHRIKRGPDFELHVRQVRAEGAEAIELRDYVPSEKWYGRGVQIEPHHLDEVIESLSDARRLLGIGGSREPGEGQGALFS